MKPDKDDQQYELMLKLIEAEQHNLKFDRYHRKPITKFLIVFFLLGIIIIIVLAVVALGLSKSHGVPVG